MYMSLSSLSSGAQALLDVSSTPDMGDVDELIVTPVASHWHRVALMLNVDRRVRMRVVARNEPNNHEGVCRDMFHCWLRGEQYTLDEERTWSTILAALSSAGFEELVKDLRRDHFKTAEANQPQSSAEPSQPQASAEPCQAKSSIKQLQGETPHICSTMSCYFSS